MGKYDQLWMRSCLLLPFVKYPSYLICFHSIGSSVNKTRDYVSWGSSVNCSWMIFVLIGPLPINRNKSISFIRLKHRNCRILILPMNSWPQTAIFSWYYSSPLGMRKKATTAWPLSLSNKISAPNSVRPLYHPMEACRVQEYCFDFFRMHILPFDLLGKK